MKHTNKPLAVILLALALSACGGAEKPESSARAEARITLFKECMELAAKMPRQADDDVSDIVTACSHQAWGMTQHVK